MHALLSGTGIHTKTATLNQEFENIRLQSSTRNLQIGRIRRFQKDAVSVPIVMKTEYTVSKTPGFVSRSGSKSLLGNLSRFCLCFVCLFVFYGSVIIKTHSARSINFYCGLRSFSAFFEQSRSRRKHASEL